MFLSTLLCTAVSMFLKSALSSQLLKRSSFHLLCSLVAITATLLVMFKISVSVFNQAVIDFTSLYIGTRTKSDCFRADVILRELFEIDHAKSKTIFISSGMSGKASLRSMLSSLLSGMKLPKTW